MKNAKRIVVCLLCKYIIYWKTGTTTTDRTNKRQLYTTDPSFWKYILRRTTLLIVLSLIIFSCTAQNVSKSKLHYCRYVSVLLQYNSYRKIIPNNNITYTANVFLFYFFYIQRDIEVKRFFIYVYISYIKTLIWTTRYFFRRNVVYYYWRK